MDAHPHVWKLIADFSRELLTLNTPEPDKNNLFKYISEILKPDNVSVTLFQSLDSLVEYSEFDMEYPKPTGYIEPRDSNKKDHILQATLVCVDNIIKQTKKYKSCPVDSIQFYYNGKLVKRDPKFSTKSISFVAIPIDPVNLQGIITLYYKKPGYKVTPALLNIFSLIGNLFSQYLTTHKFTLQLGQHINLNHELMRNISFYYEEYKKKLKAFFEIGKNIFDEEKLIESIVKYTHRIVSPRSTSLLIKDSSGNIVLKGHYGKEPQIPLTSPESPIFPLIHQVLKNKRQITKKHVKLIPIHDDEEVFGILCLQGISHEDHLPNSPHKRINRTDNMLKTLVNLASTTFQNHKLHKFELIHREMNRELKIASEIQNRLLPKRTPVIKGMEYAARSTSAKVIGGDFYDYMTLGDKYHKFVIADVAGKGISAALLMNNCRSIMKTVSREACISSREIIEKTNLYLCEDIEDKYRFVTALLLIYDEVKKCFLFTNAGHNPMYHYIRSENILIERSNVGLPLGLVEDFSFEESTFTINSGDLLILYTDGLIEAQNHDGDLYGEDNLKKLILDNVDLPCSELADLIYSTVEVFAEGCEQRDDQTLTILKKLDEETYE